MSIIDSQFRTVTCNGPQCTKTVTFNIQEKDKAKAEAVMADNPWLKTMRIVQAHGENFVYCSDECEVNNVAQGLHNPPEERKIVSIDGGGNMQIRQAAAEAAAAAEAERAIKAGESFKATVKQ